jgi:hypothetical protein
MASDFPAAHSMDTTWFAVDQEGNVGMFKSGEDGHVPEAGEELRLEELWTLRHGPPREGGELLEPWDLDDTEVAASLGLYLFDYGEDFDPIAPYSRTAAPDAPLHVDQLPPDLRRRCKQVRFAGVRFSESSLLQPLEQFECAFWYQDARVAYLCSDGQTVRPLPGQEDKFPDFCRKLREQEPDRARGLRFEGPGGEAAPSPKGEP